MVGNLFFGAVFLIPILLLAAAMKPSGHVLTPDRKARHQDVQGLYAARKLERVRTKIISEDIEEIIGDGACGWTDLKPFAPRSARVRDMEEVRGV
jgi:hypothetical protein